jgi:hypothetical protein
VDDHPPGNLPASDRPIKTGDSSVVSELKAICFREKVVNTGGHDQRQTAVRGDLEADEGARTLDLLHGKETARADRGCHEVTKALG